MAQPNVLREPSMDEILASIRRIIESNEPVVPENTVESMDQDEEFAVEAANDDSEEVTLTVDDTFEDVQTSEPEVALHVEPQRPALVESAYGTVETFHEQPAYAQPSPAPQKSLSLADVAARVRAASERGIGMRDQGYAQPAREHQNASSATTMRTPQPPRFSGSEQSFSARKESIEEAPSQAVHAAAEKPSLTETIASVATEAASVSLLSSSAGEQVARSFQDLALAIDHAERRSFDEIAEEMLRPMLQEWLDDNLPTLVERLVREEIERVARGTRR